jgi:6-pyruvoyltetrahydropterin/6-carboxytetrahydropterin synthase
MPVVEIEKSFRFEAAHRLPKVPADHKCARLHGHSFRVVVRVRGPIDADKGWLVDFADLEAAWRPLYEQLDHRCLNDVEGLENPTSELLALWLLERFHVDGVTVHSVYVAETCRSACTVYADAAEA